jgi:hypothetical protein
VQIELEGDAGHENVSGHLTEVIELPAKQKVAASIAALGIHTLVTARGAQLAK